MIGDGNSMEISERTHRHIRSFYDSYGHTYQLFVEELHALVDEGKVRADDLEEIKRKFPNQQPPPPPQIDQEPGVEMYLKNPPDSAPLRTVPLRGWVEPIADKLRVNHLQMKALLGFGDDDVLEDIQENALRILDGCNNPTDGTRHWGENKRGLVYGMVQSGKTASMLSLIQSGRLAGYRLFILFAGDKSSLRDQTQLRVNEAFNLVDGRNRDERIFSPTHISDFRQTSGGYSGNFLLDEHVVNNQDWTIIIVMKKQTNHLNSLCSQFEDLIHECDGLGKDASFLYPTMILDDEADYASQNTDVGGDGTTIYNDILRVRNTIPKNCYVAYTATPQANFSADIHSEIGYPKDFWWMLEPFRDKNKHGQLMPRTYLGAHEVFVDYETFLIHEMGRNEWPHHEKDHRGKPLGVYYPAMSLGGTGIHGSMLTNQEHDFLQEIKNKERPIPPSFFNGLADYLITCGVRWWRNWEKTKSKIKPSSDEIERSEDYKHHAMMVHLSLKQENQELIRSVVEMAWPQVRSDLNRFDPEEEDKTNVFTQRWKLQSERTNYFEQSSFLPWEEIRYFSEQCVKITEKPIFDHRSGSPYSLFENEPWAYLLNSSDEGMELNYSTKVDRQIQTKKSSIVVGGNILSRGLTINGLCVTLFGRTSMDEMMDTVLQRGRWFGHKMKEAELICLHMQEQPLEVFRQIAEADLYLRRQIKQALHDGLQPLQVLVELRNSPFISPTSKSKRKFLSQSKGFGFSGKRALLNQPSFEISDIQFNQKIIDGLLEYVRTPVLKRAQIRKDIDPDVIIDALEKFRCDDGASQVSYKVYAKYLKDWRNHAAAGKCAELPKINVAIMNDVARRQRQLSTTHHPDSPEYAQRKVTGKFGPIVGGMNDPKTYMGDGFLDYSESWHLETVSPPKSRKPGEDILIVFYRLDPNYIRKTWYDHSQKDDFNPHGKRITEQIRIPRGHPFHVPGDRSDSEGGHRNPVYAFAAWTPLGGPMYNVGVNSLIDPSDVKQIGLNKVNQEEVDNDD